MKKTVKTIGFMALVMAVVVGINMICNACGKELNTTTVAIVASMIAGSVYRMNDKKEIA